LQLGWRVRLKVLLATQEVSVIRVRLKIAGTHSGLALLHETVDSNGPYLGLKIEKAVALAESHGR